MRQTLTISLTSAADSRYNPAMLAGSRFDLITRFDGSRSNSRGLVYVVLFVLLAAALELSLSGCAARTPSKEIVMEPLHIEMNKAGMFPPEFWDSAVLMQRGQRLYDLRKYEEAAELFRRIVDDIPDSDNVEQAKFRLGLCLEALGKCEEAARMYDSMATLHRASNPDRDAIFHLGGCRECLNQWQEAADLFEKLLQNRNLTPSETVQAKCRYAVAIYKLGRIEPATVALKKAIAAYEDLDAKNIRTPGYHVARAYFHLGEIYLEKARNIQLCGTDDQMEQELKAKAQLSLDARDIYLKAVRISVPEWATASMCRIGDAYEDFYHSVMTGPIPTDLEGDDLAEYKAKLDEAMAPVLSNALFAYRYTVQLAEQFEVNNDWVKASKEKILLLDIGQ